MNHGPGFSRGPFTIGGGTMAEKAKSFDLIKIVCLAVGIVIGMMVVRVAFDLGPILGGALGGGLGAMLGLLIYGAVSKKKQQ